MKKRRIVAAISLLIVSTIAVNAQTPLKLTDKDCSLIFPRSNFCRISQDTQEIFSCEAWIRGNYDYEDEFLGYVFLKPVTYQGNQLSLLVGVSERRTIYKVRVREIDDLNQEFLAQFEGKTFDDPFEFARVPEDLLFVPSKLKAIKGNMPLSECVAGGVREIVGSVKSMTKLTSILR